MKLPWQSILIPEVTENHVAWTRIRVIEGMCEYPLLSPTVLQSLLTLIRGSPNELHCFLPFEDGLLCFVHSRENEGLESHFFEHPSSCC